MNKKMIGPAIGMTTKALHESVLPTRLQIEIAGIRPMTDQNTNGRSERVASLTRCPPLVTHSDGSVKVCLHYFYQKLGISNRTAPCALAIPPRELLRLIQSGKRPKG